MHLRFIGTPKSLRLFEDPALSLLDPHSQNPQRSYATPAVLLSRISQI